jgi:hypothetical protein
MPISGGVVLAKQEKGYKLAVSLQSASIPLSLPSDSCEVLRDQPATLPDRWELTIATQ